MRYNLFVMQRISLSLLCVCLMTFSVNAQNVGIGTTTPNANALLDLKSGNKGLLVPRMDSTSRKAIPNTKGLLVYDSTYSSFYFNTGTSWQKMSGSTGGSQLIANGNNVGDMLYWNGSNWDVIPAGKPGQQIKVGSNNIPAFAGDELPEVQTISVTNIGTRTATINAKVKKSGFSSIVSSLHDSQQTWYSARGACWSTNPNPTISDNYWMTSGSNGTYYVSPLDSTPYKVNVGGYSYSSSYVSEPNDHIDSLLMNTTYYVRAFAYNSAGIGYGNQISFTTQNGVPSLPTIGGDSSIITEIQLSSTSVKIINCNVYDNGGAVTTKGVVYSTNPNPTLANSFASAGTGTGNFEVSLTGLSPNIIYYYKVYATNSAGTVYGSQHAFTISTSNGITIASRAWSTINLSVGIDRYGQPIPKITDSTEWANATGPAWCWYKNDSATYASTYGRLYNGLAMLSVLKPIGWRVPNLEDYNSLLYAFDPSYDGNLMSYIAGGALKEAGTSHWRNPNAGASNISGFTALPGGYREGMAGSFNEIGYNGSFWGCVNSNLGGYNSYFLSLSNSNSYASIYFVYNSVYNSPGYSIRLVKDN